MLNFLKCSVKLAHQWKSRNILKWVFLYLNSPKKFLHTRIEVGFFTALLAISIFDVLLRERSYKNVKQNCMSLLWCRTLHLHLVYGISQNPWSAYSLASTLTQTCLVSDERCERMWVWTGVNAGLSGHGWKLVTVSLSGREYERDWLPASGS